MPSLPIKNDNKAGGSNTLPWLKSQIQSAMVELTKKVTHKELEEKITSLETIVKREQWPTKERKVEPESEPSIEEAKGFDEKRQKIGKSAVKRIWLK